MYSIRGFNRFVSDRTRLEAMSEFDGPVTITLDTGESYVGVVSSYGSDPEGTALFNFIGETRLESGHIYVADLVSISGDTP